MKEDGNNMGVIYDEGDPVFVNFKKHYCPKCNELLKTKYNKKVISSTSSEANIVMVDMYMNGDIDVFTRLFYCDKCNFEISIADMKKYENEQKKLSKK